MGKFQAMPKYFVVFVALVACNIDSFLTQARPVKPLNQHSSLNTGTVVTEDNSQLPLPPLKTRVNNVPTPLSVKKVDSSIIPSYDVASFEDSGATHTNAFRPTTPGGSPGVGHRKFVGEDKNMKTMVVVQSPDVERSVTEISQNGFKPTNPGHSPGVGHRKFAGEDKNMKAMVVVQSPDVERSMTEISENGFKPTNPGHSPGVGHRKFAREDKNMKTMVVNGFKPTNPGHSPGVGHRKFARDDDKNMKTKVVVQSLDVEHYVTEISKNGFKPTNPGHSPGVGHAYQTKIGQLN